MNREPLTREDLLKQIEHAKAEIAKKPWWQQNLLVESMKSTCDTPRKPVDNGQYDYYY